jgi:hypothetical protein
MSVDGGDSAVGGGISSVDSQNGFVLFDCVVNVVLLFEEDGIVTAGVGVSGVGN